MRKPVTVSCNACYFRAAGLCALAGDIPCPTFRAVTGQTLTPPQQAPLIARPLQPLVASGAAA